MEKKTALKITNLKKRYRLGQIGGGTLQGDLQSWWARIHGKEDPNSMIGYDQRSNGKTFMALNGINLTVYQGEALGIIGSNGAGKSTLLKILSRVTAPTEGTLDIYGRIASMLEVGTGFNGEMTGRENVYMNGAILGMSKAEIDRKMEQIIDFSEVREFIDTPVKRYSSGMYVKLAFSVAAHLDSEIMIMDEVLAVGDMAFQKKCLEKMREAATKEGRTVLYVSHNMSTIRQLCTRCIVLDKGKIVFDGKVDEAIEVYMSVGGIIRDIEFDLSQKRMKHLPSKIRAKMLKLSLVGKKSPIYGMNEDINLSLIVEVFEKISNLCCRIELSGFDDTYIGTSFMNDPCNYVDTGNVMINMRTSFKGLVPGRYNALLVIYEINEWGGYTDLDAIKDAFMFEIADVDNSLGINWNSYSWGKIKFDDIKRLS